jgi:hypothetical protein
VPQKTDRYLVARVKRCGKSAPAFRVTGMARQTPPEARPRRPHHGAVAQVLEGCSPEPAGRPLEAPGDGVSRWMVAAALPDNAEQNPAYRPTRPPRAWGVAEPITVPTRYLFGDDRIIRVVRRAELPSVTLCR